MNAYRIDSLAVHAGSRTTTPGFRGTSPPIEASSAFVAESVDQLYAVFRGAPGVVYSRLGNPTVMALELETHPAVARVHYPGLANHPQHALAAALFGGERFGGMLAFDLAGGTRARAMAVLGRLELVRPATTLGDVASLALFPAASSHRELSAAELAELGIGEGLLRLSVGIEDPRDIIADLDRALATA
ncbi:MAG: PLP-dependent transferase [Deltaproteobacteria bacterium]|nr:PLP-dependent transferase [Deltaproteobacteria bacterium]